MERGQRLGLIVAAIVVAVGAFVLLRPSGDDDTGETNTVVATETAPAPPGTAPEEGDEVPAAEPPEPAPPQVTRVRVRGGEPVGGVTRIEAERGDTVRFTVSSDTPQHIHLHGYDVFEDAAPGAPARFRVKADIEGIFEIELEGPGVQVAELRVEP